MQIHQIPLELLPTRGTSLAGVHFGDRPLFPAVPAAAKVRTPSGTWEQGGVVSGVKQSELGIEHWTLVRVCIDLAVRAGILLQNPDGTLMKKGSGELQVAYKVISKLLFGTSRITQTMKKEETIKDYITRLFVEIKNGSILFTGNDKNPYLIPFFTPALGMGEGVVILDFHSAFLRAFGQTEFVQLVPSSQLLGMVNRNAQCLIPWITSRIDSPTREVPELFTVEEMLIYCGHSPEEVAEMAPSKQWRLFNRESKSGSTIAIMNGAMTIDGKTLCAEIEEVKRSDGTKIKLVAIYETDSKDKLKEMFRLSDFMRKTWIKAGGSTESFETYIQTVKPVEGLTASEKNALMMLKIDTDNRPTWENQLNIKAIFEREGRSYLMMLKSVLESKGVKNAHAIITVRLAELIELRAQRAVKMEITTSKVTPLPTTVRIVNSQPDLEF